jgi:hypothetical protein
MHDVRFGHLRGECPTARRETVLTPVKGRREATVSISPDCIGLDSGGLRVEQDHERATGVGRGGVRRGWRGESAQQGGKEQ